MKKTCPETKAIVITDMGAVSLLEDRRADYYFGTCENGSSAATSILIGLTGYRRCCIVYKNGGRPSKEKIREYVEDGKICFGVTVSSIDGIMPVLMKVLLEQENH